MPKTNFERFIQGIGKFAERASEARKQYQEYQQYPATGSSRLPSSQSVIEISFLTEWYDTTQKAIKEEIADFYREFPAPFVEVYETEIFKTNKRGCFFTWVSFAVLVQAPKRIAKKEMESRCHSIVATEQGMLAYKVSVDNSYQ